MKKKKQKQTKQQIATDANVPCGDPITFSQFTEKVGKIGHLVKKYTQMPLLRKASSTTSSTQMQRQSMRKT